MSFSLHRTAEETQSLHFKASQASVISLWSVVHSQYLLRTNVPTAVLVVAAEYYPCFWTCLDILVVFTDLPTCLLCVCLTGSVYCEEVSPDMTTVPALPKETAYLYARFNKIQKIGNKDFADILTLKRIDLTGNIISEIEDGAFSKLSLLEELSLAENRLVKLPMLPAKLTTFNANFNRLKTKGVKANAFKKLSKLSNLYLSDNQLEAVPHIPENVRTLHLQNNNISDVSVDTFCRSNDTYYLRPRLTEIRLDGNPVVLSKNPDTFTCLNVLPVGQYRR
uniref:Mimecan n=1 Tax=Neogobius melanostomus TaxID=47308 RepID=A0A8C6UGT0_9GOBI